MNRDSHALRDWLSFAPACDRIKHTHHTDWLSPHNPTQTPTHLHWLSEAGSCCWQSLFPQSFQAFKTAFQLSWGSFYAESAPVFVWDAKFWSKIKPAHTCSHVLLPGMLQDDLGAGEREVWRELSWHWWWEVESEICRELGSCNSFCRRYCFW